MYLMYAAGSPARTACRCSASRDEGDLTGGGARTGSCSRTCSLARAVLP